MWNLIDTVSIEPCCRCAADVCGCAEGETCECGDACPCGGCACTDDVCPCGSCH